MRPAHIPAILWLPVFLSFTISCADDTNAGDDEVAGDTGGDDEENEDDEAGEALPPEPVDPLEGGGGIPPQTTDPTRSWLAPTTLGNGLVHDSRRAVDPTHHQRNFGNADLADGVPWSGFVANYDAMTEVGFRPAQVRAEVSATATPGGTKLEIVDQTIYIADDDANYQTQIETYLFANVPAERNFAAFAPAAQGARPVSIDTFAVEGADVEVGYSVAWVYDDVAMPWMILAGQSAPSMATKLDELAGKGFRPISISSRWRGLANEYAAILVDDGMPSPDWAVTLGLDSAALESKTQTMWQAGFYPIRVTTEHGFAGRVNMLWMRRPPGISVQVRTNLIDDTFATQDAHWRSRGYHLESADHYHDGEASRQLAVWVRYEPYLRWKGTAFAPDDAEYLSRYRMFHDQANRTMSFATQIDCSGGQPCPSGTSCFACPDDDTPCFHDDVCVEPKFRKLLRPSGTLHVFEGEELVLSRAYTFAPAVYAETPIHAPMKLASVSKSITAAAVVREMAEQGLALTSSFNAVAGIQGAPVAMDAVTVLDVLRNLGGFMPNAASYGDHGMIDASVYGTIPIDGEEMLNYAVAGHLGVDGMDNYWDAMIYEKGQTNALLVYSNPGFSMLGELVRVLSGVSYEEYVVGNLLVPLGMNQTVFRDPGHRVLERGVTLTGLRSYLLNADHPYHVKPPQQALAMDDCPPSSLGWVWDGADCTWLWGCECEGPDCGRLYDTEPDCENDHLSPLSELEQLPASRYGDGSTTWSSNVGPLDAQGPDRASRGRYSGDFYMGGAPLAAGGWHADGKSLGILIRALAQSEALMPSSVSSQLWNPQWWNRNGSPAPNWSYGLGWYVRGNWVAWAGGAQGSMATVLHNRAHDFTVVYLTNVRGNGIDEFIDPLMTPMLQAWNTSPVGAVLPCQDDVESPANECSALNPPFTVPY
jgi:CubicO group peptidase (beta-lactamase class C family)